MLPSGPPRRRNNAFVSSCCQATTKSGAWLLVLCASNAASGAGLLPPPLMCCPSSCFLAFVCSEPTGVSGAEVSAEEGRSITRGNTRRVSCVCVCVCVNVAARKHRHDKVLATSSATCSANVKGLLWLTRSKPGCPRRLSWAMTTLPT